MGWFEISGWIMTALSLGVALVQTYPQKNLRLVSPSTVHGTIPRSSRPGPATQDRIGVPKALRRDR